LSQVSRLIRPLIEARVHKPVRHSAVLMSLSRIQSKLVPTEEFKDLSIDNISIHSGLCSLTVFKTPAVHEQLNRLFSKVRGQGRFITITEGINEVTAILEDDDFLLAQGMLSETLQYVYREIASVGVKLSDEMLVKPGVIYQLLQQVALQNVNVIEVASTATEFNLYVREQDARLAFDSIYQRFAKRASRKSDQL
jgi:aspartokinase